MAKRTRITAGRLSVGSVVDPATGRPIGPRGISVLSVTRGISGELVHHAQPASLIGPTETTGRRIAPEARDAGALLVYPVYVRTPEGLLGWKVVACRIGLRQHRRTGRCYETYVSNALILDWQTWLECGQELSTVLDEIVDLAAPVMAEGARQRLDVPPERLSIDPRTSNRIAEAERIVAALKAGKRAVLGRETCDTEREFLRLVGAALRLLPAELRGHVSFASGYVRHEDGLQIVWLPDRTLEEPLTVEAGRPRLMEQTLRLTSRHLNGAKGPLISMACDAVTRKRLMRSVRAQVMHALEADTRGAGADRARAGKMDIEAGVTARAQSKASVNPIDIVTMLRRKWLPPVVLAKVMATDAVMAALAEGVEQGEQTIAELVVVTAAIAECAGGNFRGAGEALLSSLAPLDLTAATFTPERLRTPEVLSAVNRYLETERERLIRLGKPVPRWLTAARKAASAGLMRQCTAPVQGKRIVAAPAARRGAPI